jgi:1-acyl-sn-glycerol-3-phosphate acyltransferase
MRTAVRDMTRLLYHRARGKLDAKTARTIYQPWSRNVIEKLGGKLILEGVAPLEKPCLYVGNHMSYLDIPLLWALTECVFVSKEEIRYWPVIGAAAMAVDTIFVTRESKSSRGKAAEQIAKSINEKQKRVAIFPEGTSSIEGKAWRHGAFVIAQRYGIPVQPFRLFYTPSRDAAYIDKDNLVAQVWKLIQHPGFEARLKFFDPIEVTSAQEDCRRIQDMVQADQRACVAAERAASAVSVGGTSPA